jgi:hypothetical protein
MLDLPCWSIAEVWCKDQEECPRASHGQNDGQIGSYARDRLSTTLAEVGLWEVCRDRYWETPMEA